MACAKSPVISDRAATNRLPKLCPPSSDSVWNLCWKSWESSCSSSESATMQLRRSPGGNMLKSLRKRPEEPPSSVTVTTAARSAIAPEAKLLWPGGFPPGRTQNKITKRTQFGPLFSIQAQNESQIPAAGGSPEAHAVQMQQCYTMQHEIEKRLLVAGVGLTAGRTPEAIQKDGPQVKIGLPPKNRRGRAKKLMDGSIIRSPIFFNKLGFVCSKHGGPHPPATAPKSKGPAGRTQPGLESCGSTHTAGWRYLSNSSKLPMSSIRTLRHPR